MVENLVDYFKKFPGTGPRQARRFVYHLLRQDQAFIDRFVREIQNVKENSKICQESCAHFYSTDPTQTLSPIARDPNRNNTQLMVVAYDTDLENIEKQHVYNGKYFVLGGLIGALENDPQKRIRADKLEKLVEEKVKNGLTEIILALPVNTDGEHTKEYVANMLEKYEDGGMSVTSLGRGLSTGTELEYIDTQTMQSALENRKSIH